MLCLPVLEGLIKRRLLINFRAEPAVVQQLLPKGFRPKLHDGEAVVGICLIRLEEIRAKGLPPLLGLASENAAHRIAVQWTEADGTEREGVFIPRRDTGSALNALAGGRVFPGEHHYAKFHVSDDGHSVQLGMKSQDKEVALRVEGHASEAWPEASGFASLKEASAFFEGGCVGYSVTEDATRLDGMELKTQLWSVEPFAVTRVESSFFEDAARFPQGSIRFDHGLIMRDIPHEWHGKGSFQTE